MHLVTLLLCFAALLINAFVDSRVRVSDEKCAYYRNITPSLPREFNETDDDAAPKEFPFMVTIKNDTHHGNGILISENFVLSPASSMPIHDGIFVLLGFLERYTSLDDAQLQIYDVIEVIVHPDYNDDDRRSDIKLVKLNQSVKFSEYVRPACLSPSPISQHLIEIGWSDTNIRNTKRLHKIKLHYISNNSCRTAFKSEDRGKFISGIDHETIFCAATATNEVDKTMCSGYLGSAVINADRKAFNEIVGIASLNFICNSGTTDVFVSVFAYIDWIETIVWPTEPFPIAYILLIAAGTAFVLICVCLIVFCGVSRSRDKQNHQNIMNVHMHITH